LGLYFAERVFIDDLPVDRIVHELPRELDPSVDRGSVQSGTDTSFPVVG
jgi:hypothetical protein